MQNSGWTGLWPDFFFLCMNFLHSCFEFLYFLWSFLFMPILIDSLPFSTLSFKDLKGSSIKVIFNSSRTAANMSFVAAFLNAFRFDVSIALLTVSARIKANTFVSYAVQFVAVFYELLPLRLFFTFSLKVFFNVILCRTDFLSSCSYTVDFQIVLTYFKIS